MPSIRDGLLTALVARVDGITGISAELRGARNTMPSKVHAVVFPLGEDKDLANSHSYLANYQVGIALTVRREDADATLDGGNPYRYLDRQVTAVEQVIHAPDSWGVSPDFTDVVVTGHEVEEPTETNEYQAVISLRFTYQHDYQDPTAA